MSESIDEIKAQILNTVNGFSNKKATFPEVSNGMSWFKGDSHMMLAGVSNITLWGGMSTIAITAIQDLINEGEIHFYPGDVFDYFHSGYILNAPIAKKIKSYSKLHWLPTLIAIGPKRK